MMFLPPSPLSPLPSQALGQLGRVVKLRSDDNVKVAVNGRRWIMNPLCLCPAPGATPLEEEEGTGTKGGTL